MRFTPMQMKRDGYRNCVRDFCHHKLVCSLLDFVMAVSFY